MSWVDIIDIIAVSFLLYQVYRLMQGSVALRIFLGFLFLYLIYLVVRAAEMELLSSILGQFMGVGVIAAIILFQQEIRKFLLLLGRTSILSRENNFINLIFRKNANEPEFNITPIIEAAKSLGGTNTGALLVFSKNSELKFYAESGDLIDAIVSKRILMAIFNKTSPLHDGAVIIYKGRIKAARCVLPVTERDNVPAQYGMRHRAAIGMTEATDTLVLSVSEETGQLSIARNGKIYGNLSAQEIRARINEYLFDSDGKRRVTEKEKPKKEKKKDKELPKEEPDVQEELLKES